MLHVLKLSKVHACEGKVVYKMIRIRCNLSISLYFSLFTFFFLIFSKILGGLVSLDPLIATPLVQVSLTSSTSSVACDDIIYMLVMKLLT